MYMKRGVDAKNSLSPDIHMVIISLVMWYLPWFSFFFFFHFKFEKEPRATDRRKPGKHIIF